MRKEELQMLSSIVFIMEMTSTFISVALFFLKRDANLGITVVTSAKKVKSSNKLDNFIKKLKWI